MDSVLSSSQGFSRYSMLFAVLIFTIGALAGVGADAGNVMPSALHFTASTSMDSATYRYTSAASYCDEIGGRLVRGLTTAHYIGYLNAASSAVGSDSTFVSFLGATRVGECTQSGGACEWVWQQTDIKSGGGLSIEREAEVAVFFKGAEATTGMCGSNAICKWLPGYPTAVDHPALLHSRSSAGDDGWVSVDGTAKLSNADATPVSLCEVRDVNVQVFYASTGSPSSNSSNTTSKTANSASDIALMVGIYAGIFVGCVLIMVVFTVVYFCCFYEKDEPASKSAAPARPTTAAAARNEAADGRSSLIVLDGVFGGNPFNTMARQPLPTKVLTDDSSKSSGKVADENSRRLSEYLEATLMESISTPSILVAPQAAAIQDTPTLSSASNYSYPSSQIKDQPVQKVASPNRATAPSSPPGKSKPAASPVPVQNTLNQRQVRPSPVPVFVAPRPPFVPNAGPVQGAPVPGPFGYGMNQPNMGMGLPQFTGPMRGAPNTVGMMPPQNYSGDGSNGRNSNNPNSRDPSVCSGSRGGSSAFGQRRSMEDSVGLDGRNLSHLSIDEVRRLRRLQSVDDGITEYGQFVNTSHHSFSDTD